jgi:hypothetical protein
MHLFYYVKKPCLAMSDKAASAAGAKFFFSQAGQAFALTAATKASPPPYN